MTGARDRPGAAREAAGVFLLSAAVIALELALMRCLAVAQWHHFSYLVISTALLGFGASGTFLAFFRARLARHHAASCAAFSLGFALAGALGFRAAEALPLDARYVLYSWRQAALMVAYHGLILVPFFLSACAIGLALLRKESQTAVTYAANLTGSALGGAAGLGIMFLLPAAQVVDAAAAGGLAAGLAWALGCNARRRAAAAAVALGAAFAGLVVLWPARLNIDPYKALAHIRTLASEGRARHVATRHGPRGRLDVYSSPAFHQTAFAGLTATEAPPPQLALLLDGDLAAPVFSITSAEDATILDYTPMALAYAFVRRPRVLLLGEVGGTNVWLARRMGARHITVVQPDPQIPALMLGPLADLGGDVLHGDDVTVCVSSPRAFLAAAADEYDLIEVVTTEGQAAGVSGLRSLNEDFLLTTEGIAACLRRLSDGGVLSVARGRQEPPRDNVRLLATVRTALSRVGATDPGTHLIQAHNYLAAVTLAFRRPLAVEQCRALADETDRLGLDVDWAPCEGLAERELRNPTEGPAGKPYSYLQFAAAELLAGDPVAFTERWLYDVRPPTDDRPYFYSFFRWRSLPRLREAYGEQWLARSELGYVVLVAVLVEVLVLGALLILVPLLLLRGWRRVHGRAATVTCFGALGLGYMLTEMVCILRFTLVVGDPLYSAALVIPAFLAFSGLGSLTGTRFGWPARRKAAGAAVLVAALGVLCAVGLGPLSRALLPLPQAARVVLAVLFVAPVAFVMGWPFPNALSVVQRERASLGPWAWGVNGFASVAASPLAVIVALHWGYTLVLLAAAAAYLCAAFAAARLPGTPRAGG